MTSPLRVAVVGAGLSGLVCGALLAARGRDVTILEALDAPGGVARAAGGGGEASFSPGPQYVWGWEAGGPAWDALAELDVDVEMRAMPRCFERVSFGDAPFRPVEDTSPAELGALAAPQRAAAARVLDVLSQAGAVAPAVGRRATFRGGRREMLASILGSEATLSQKRWALAIADLTVAELARRLGADARTLRLVTHPQAIFAESLEDLSALLYACARHHLCRGVFVPTGGFGALVDALVGACASAGARVVTRAPVVGVEAVAAGTALTTTIGEGVFDHVVWACSPGAVARVARRSTSRVFRGAGASLHEAFEPSHPILSLNAYVTLDAREVEVLRDRNFTWFADDSDVGFGATSDAPGRTINFGSPTLNGRVSTDEHVICAFSNVGEPDLEGLLRHGLARLGVHAAPRRIEVMTPEVWTRAFGGFEGSVYGRRLTPSSLQRPLAGRLPTGWSLCHSGAGISGVLGALQSGLACADALAPRASRRAS
jgi:phytoene dehydrogenase-like protein